MQTQLDREQALKEKIRKGNLLKWDSFLSISMEYLQADIEEEHFIRIWIMLHKGCFDVNLYDDLGMNDDKLNFPQNKKFKRIKHAVNFCEKWYQNYKLEQILNQKE